jgi:Xaa-Pro aminopeptidase
MRKLASVLFLLSVAACALDRQPNADYRARREAVARKAESGVVLIFAAVEEEGPNAIYGFRQSNNFYYLSGWTEPGAALLIAPAVEAKENKPARPYQEILFLPPHDAAEEKWTGPKLGADDPRATDLTGFDRVEPLTKLDEELSRFLSRGSTLYTEKSDGADSSRSSVAWLKRTNAIPSGVTYQSASPLLTSVRTIKDAGEIALVRRATEASIAAHIAAMHAMKPSLNERDISARMQYEWGKQGCERPAYSPIVGAGFSSTVLHYSEDSAVIQNGDIVVIDAAGEYSMYASDVTRTLPASGKFTPRQREIYDIVLGAQEAAIAAFQPGKSTIGRDKGPDSLFKAAYDYINTHGKDLHGKPLGEYFIHGLSHYVGLSVHDENDYTIPLAPGMVFTIEPGIYIPEEKLGARIEDTFYVDKDGKLVNLSAGAPRKAEEVERMMAVHTPLP